MNWDTDLGPVRPPRAIHLLLLAASAGVLAGVLWGAHELDLQGYVELEFWRTAAYLVRGQVLDGLLFGCAVGAWTTGVWLGAYMLWRDPVAWLRPRGFTSAIRAVRRAPGSLAAPALAALLVLAVLSARLGALTSSYVLAALVAVLGWALVEGLELLRGRVRFGSCLFALWLLLPAAFLIADRRAVYATFDIARYPAELTFLAGLAAFLTLALLALITTGQRRLPQPRAVRWLVGLAELPLLGGVLAVLAAPLLSPRVEVEHPCNVVIIGIDTLRVDHTSLAEASHGGRDLTPRIAALAERGSIFTNAISQAPWTLPAFASIFTGLYPHEHAAISITGHLRKSELTLPELMREAGYATGSIVSHYFVNNTHGFGQGYDYFNRDNVLGEYEITSEDISDLAIHWLDEQGEQPFFLFLHYFDPHYEYRDHGDAGWADGYEGWVRDEMHIDGLRHKRHLMEPQDVQYLKDLYDEEIRYTDAQIGRVLDHLEATGRDGDTLIVVVSDHGEEFLERGWFGHSISMSEQVLHVPLVVVPPSGEKVVARVEDTVETRAVFATVLDAAGADWDPNVLRHSLLPLVRGERGRAAGDDGARNRAFASVWTPDAEPEWGKRALLTAIRTDRYKLVRDRLQDRDFLFDLQADPGETENLVETRPELAETLGAELEEWFEKMDRALTSIPQRGAIAGEMAAKLKALGYL